MSVLAQDRIDPSCIVGMIEHGLQPLPARISDKKPTMKWAKYQDPFVHVPAHKFRGASAVVIICGQASGNLEVIDFDEEGLDAEFFAHIERDRPDLLERLQIVRTPRGGVHLRYRCDLVGGNTKLARRPVEGGKAKVRIETRGEGGYVLSPPSPGYAFERGPEWPVEISVDDREYLHELARGYDLMPQREEPSGRLLDGAPPWSDDEIPDYQREEIPASTMDPMERARRYLANFPPAVSHEDGHTTAFLAAQHVLGFGLSDDEAMTVLRKWNVNCQPPWSEEELRHKVSQARKKGRTVRPGDHLRQEPTRSPDRVSAASGGPEQDVPTYGIDDLVMTPLRIDKSGGWDRIVVRMTREGKDLGQVAVTASVNGIDKALRIIRSKLGATMRTTANEALRPVLEDLVNDVETGRFDWLRSVADDAREQTDLAEFVAERMPHLIDFRCRSWCMEKAYIDGVDRPLAVSSIVQRVVDADLIQAAKTTWTGKPKAETTWENNLTSAVRVWLRKRLKELDPPDMLRALANELVRAGTRDYRTENTAAVDILKTATQCADSATGAKPSWTPAGARRAIWVMPTHPFVAPWVRIAFGVKLIAELDMVDPIPEDEFRASDIFVGEVQRATGAEDGFGTHDGAVEHSRLTLELRPDLVPEFLRMLGGEVRPKAEAEDVA